MVKEIKKGEIIIYKADDKIKIDVSLKNETIWLTQDQIAKLFGTQRPAITKHLNNIFKSGELDEKSNVPKWNMLLRLKNQLLQKLQQFKSGGAICKKCIMQIMIKRQLFVNSE